MKLTIDISRSEYEDICYNAINYKNTVGDALLKAIALGEEQKTGHWIDIDEEPHEDWECDRCGHIEYANEDLPDKYHFCPNCGAKMIEPQESEAQSADSN